MKTRPILYTSEMVLAILADRKTKTRRVMKPQPQPFACAAPGEFWYIPFAGWPDGRMGRGEMPTLLRPHCPYGVPGDRLWVQEGYQLSGFTPDELRVAVRGDEGLPITCHYLADNTTRPVNLTPAEARKLARRVDPYRPQPGRFMYRSCARILLEIEGVGVERVQDIGEMEAQAEGCDVRLLAKLIKPLEARAKIKPLHWIRNAGDEGYLCRACAQKRIRELRREEPDEEFELDGGWMIECDGEAFCETCGEVLECTYTDYGVEEDLAGLERSGINNPTDAYCAANVINLGGNPLLTEKCGDWHYRPEWTGRIARLCFRTLWDRINGQREGCSWDANPYVWVVGFRRVEG